MNIQVAMKFTPTEEQFEAAKEYAVYAYLNAFNKTDVQNSFGIPSVYYFGLWNDHVLMAITLLDTDCRRKAIKNEINELDTIIIFREFVSETKVIKIVILIECHFLKVRITKYIHGHGVRHEDIKLDNIMFRGHQGFIIGIHFKSIQTTLGSKCKKLKKTISFQFRF